VFERAGIKVMKWPANSPDLNPIETVWDWMKDYIQEHYAKVHSSYPKLRKAILEAWESITHEQIRDLIRGMKKRC
jgi:transposase